MPPRRLLRLHGPLLRPFILFVVPWSPFSDCRRVDPCIPGDHNPRDYEFTLEFQVLDASKDTHSLGVAILLAVCRVLITRSFRADCRWSAV